MKNKKMKLVGKPKKALKNPFEEIQKEQKDHVALLHHIAQRFMALEEYLEESDPGFMAQHTIRIMAIQDRQDGFELREVVEKGSRARIQYYLYEEAKSDEKGLKRTAMADEVGSGKCLRLDLEVQLIGMRVGDTKSISFHPEDEDNKELETAYVLEVTVITAASKPEPLQEVKDED